jgi:septal ring factor EnvC (AmiA/AmiB activator)
MRYIRFLFSLLMFWAAPSKAQIDSTLLFERSKGKLIYPLTKFSNIANPFCDTNRLFLCGPNPGLTFTTDQRDSVLSIYDGQVSLISNIGKRHLVIIRFGSYFITYFGLNVPFVSRGDKVTVGQIIATVFQDDDNKGELDLMISHGDKLLDPKIWLER